MLLNDTLGAVRHAVPFRLVFFILPINRCHFLFLVIEGKSPNVPRSILVALHHPLHHRISRRQSPPPMIWQRVRVDSYRNVRGVEGYA